MMKIPDEVLMILATRIGLFFILWGVAKIISAYKGKEV